jgi:hypothetical protein
MFLYLYTVYTYIYICEMYKYILHVFSFHHGIIMGLYKTTINACIPTVCPYEQAIVDGLLPEIDNETAGVAEAAHGGAATGLGCHSLGGWKTRGKTRGKQPLLMVNNS